MKDKKNLFPILRGEKCICVRFRIKSGGELSESDRDLSVRYTLL